MQRKKPERSKYRRRGGEPHARPTADALVLNPFGSSKHNFQLSSSPVSAFGRKLMDRACYGQARLDQRSAKRSKLLTPREKKMKVIKRSAIGVLSLTLVSLVSACGTTTKETTTYVPAPPPQVIVQAPPADPAPSSPTTTTSTSSDRTSNSSSSGPNAGTQDSSSQHHSESTTTTPSN